MESTAECAFSLFYGNCTCLTFFRTSSSLLKIPIQRPVDMQADARSPRVPGARITRTSFALRASKIERWFSGTHEVRPVPNVKGTKHGSNLRNTEKGPAHQLKTPEAISRIHYAPDGESIAVQEHGSVIRRLEIRNLPRDSHKWDFVPGKLDALEGVRTKLVVAHLKLISSSLTPPDQRLQVQSSRRPFIHCHEVRILLGSRVSFTQRPRIVQIAHWLLQCP